MADKVNLHASRRQAIQRIGGTAGAWTITASRRLRLAGAGRANGALARRLAAGLLPAGVVACAAPANRIAAPSGFLPPPAPRPGERWRYRLINRFNELPTGDVLAEVTAGLPELVVTLTAGNGQAMGSEVHDGAWNIVREPTYGQTLLFDQPVPLLPRSLAVGSRSTTITSYRLPAGSIVRSWRAQLTAVGWERIVVPAGRFDCLRIDRTIHFDHYDMGRLNARRVESLWYAPVMNRWVMREWAGFYNDESSLDRRRFAIGEREDSVRWELVEHVPAPMAT